MGLKHKVQINVANKNGEKQRVVSGATLRLPQRLLKMIFGDFCEVLVITPGKSVEGIEIKEVKAGDRYV